jgi:non-specific serine/threonine protein kinase
MSSSGENQASWIQPDEESLLDRFEEGWRSHPPGDLDEFLANAEGGGLKPPVGLLEELIKIDLEYRWRCFGRLPATSSAAPLAAEAICGYPARPRLEDYAARHPDATSSLDLIAEEYRVRCRWGDGPSGDEYLRRFPGFAAQLPDRLRRVEAELRGDSTQGQGAAGTQREDHADDVDMPTLCDLPASRPSSCASDPSIELPPAKDSAPRPLPKTIGRYEVVKLLGEGAFGAVYLANDPQLKRRVAIKTPHARHLRNRRSRKQFLEEAQLAAQLSHPVLVSIYDIEAAGDECYLVMEYIEGKPLSEVLRDDWPQRRDLHYAARLLADVAEAVHEAHKRGLVHRDLKPANILIDQAGRPHVTDFGLAIHEEDQRRRAWEVSGTPAYMAPEQVRGESHRLDGRCDIWSLGAILYEMLTGRRAFSGRNVHDIFDEIVHREPKPPRQIDDRLPGSLERICLRCLAKDVSARYTTARDLCDDLRQFLEAEAADSSGDWSIVLGRSLPLRSSSVLSASTHHSSLASVTANLPQPSGTFIGRQQELAEVKRLILDEKAPVVTLLGPGGMGKTRLAQQVAHVLAQPFPGGCWWADLTAATSAARIARAVLAAFGAAAAEGEAPVERVSSVLHYRPRLLLVLDNFEQVVEHATATVGEWRQRAPHVQFLVTSREPLGLAGERHYELAPLPIPDANAPPESVERLAQYASVELFVRRAQEADARFKLDPSNAADVARICAKLEGLPLALELAAARIKIAKPAQMLKKFDQKFQFLKSTRRDLSDRQRTLEGAIQWSYDLLEPWEQSAFLQVAAFAGGFSLDAAEAVIDLAAFSDAPAVIDLVQSLREKCLLRTVDERYELRLGMYQSIREFGEQKRIAEFSPVEEISLQERVAEYLIAYCETWRQAIHSRDGVEALDRIALETENLFAVQDWAAAQNRSELTAGAILALAAMMAVRGPADQRRPRLERALPGAPASCRGRLLAELSLACHASGDWDQAAEYADRAVADGQAALEIATRNTDDLAHLARALGQQGVMRRLRGDTAGALESFRQSEETARQADDRHAMTAAIAQRGFLVWQCGEFDEALECYARAERLARELGDRADLAVIARQRGQLYAQRGDYAAALADFEQAERLAKELEDRRLLHLATSARGTIYSDQGKFNEALECYEKAERLARQLGEKRSVAVNRGNRGLVYADRGEYEKALSYYADAEALNREVGVPSGIALNIGNRGAALAGLGRYDEALACLNEAERLHQKIGNRLQEAMNRGERGGVLLALGRWDAAIECLTAGLATVDELHAAQTPEGFNILTGLAAAYAQEGRAREALDAADRARQLAALLNLTPEHPRLRIRENLTRLQTLTNG